MLKDKGSVEEGIIKRLIIKCTKLIDESIKVDDVELIIYKRMLKIIIGKLPTIISNLKLIN